MNRVIRCTCRSHCLTFNPETQSYEGGGKLVPKSTAANHRQDDLLSQTLNAFTQDVAMQVLSDPLSPEYLHHHLHNPGFRDLFTPSPGFHNQSPTEDFYFVLEAETTNRCTWAPINHSLVFASDPPPTLPYRRPLASEVHIPNREPYALDPQNPVNEAYLVNESRLCEIVVALERRPVSDVRDHLRTRVYEGLAMMDHHKETEWNRQRAGSVARLRGYSVVETGARALPLSQHAPLTQKPKIRSLFQQPTPQQSGYLHLLLNNPHSPPVFPSNQSRNQGDDCWDPEYLDCSAGGTRNH